MSASDLHVIARVLKPFHRTNISGMPKQQVRHLLNQVGGSLPGWDHPKHWIQKAIKHPGKFRKFAEEHNGLDSTGRIDPNFIKHIIRNPPSMRIKKEAVLARTLSKLRHGGCYNPDSKSCPTNILRRKLGKMKME